MDKWLRVKVLSRSDRCLSFGLYTIGLIAHLILLRYPPDAFFYNIDELSLTFSCLDRFLGVPSTIMAEPSSVLQMLSVPLFLMDFVVRRGIPSSQSRALDTFSAYLADAYADPRHHVLLIRALVAVISCIGPILLYAICRKLGALQVPSLLCAIVLSIHPAFFGQSLLAAGDSLGLTAVLGSTLILLNTDKRAATISFAGFIYAMAIAFKFTMAGCLVLLVAIMSVDPELQSPRRLIRSLCQLGAGIVAGLLLWWPYIWTEPLRTAKAILGNVNKVGSHADGFQFLAKLKESAGTAFVVFIIAVVLACSWAWRRSPARKLILALLCSTVIMSVPLIMRATSAYPRYFMPLALAPLLCFVLITINSARLSMSILGLLALATAVPSIRNQIAFRIPNEQVIALKEVPRFPSGAKVYLPEEAAVTYAFRLPESAYRRISAHAREVMDGRGGVIAFLRANGIPDKSIQILVTNFNEDEQANAARTATAAESKLNSTSGAEVYLYRTNGTDRTSWADISQATAITLFKGSAPAAILVRSTERQLGKPIWQGSQWAWYYNEGTPR